MLNYQSYPKNKTGYPFFGPPCSVVAEFQPKTCRNLAGNFCLPQNSAEPYSWFGRINFSKNLARKSDYLTALVDSTWTPVLLVLAACTQLYWQLHTQPLQEHCIIWQNWLTTSSTRKQSETADLRQRHVVRQVAAPYSVWQQFPLCPPIGSNVNGNFKVIQNPGFLPDHPQNWTTGSFCQFRHSQKISKRSVHNFLSYLADTQTENLSLAKT